MSGRSYALINVGEARRLARKGLSHEARSLRIALEVSPLTTFEGLFEYPLELATIDVGLAPDEARKAMEELINAGEVEYDFEETSCRIIGGMTAQTARPTRAWPASGFAT